MLSLTKRSRNYDPLLTQLGCGLPFRLTFRNPLNTTLTAIWPTKTPSGEPYVPFECNGEPVTDEQGCLVATNSYRALGSGAFPGLNGSNIVIGSPDENCQALSDYLAAEKSVNPSADDNRSFSELPGEVTTTLESAAAQEYIPDKILR